MNPKRHMVVASYPRHREFSTVNTFRYCPLKASNRLEARQGLTIVDFERAFAFAQNNNIRKS